MKKKKLFIDHTSWTTAGENCHLAVKATNQVFKFQGRSIAVY